MSVSTIGGHRGRCHGQWDCPSCRHEKHQCDSARRKNRITIRGSIVGSREDLAEAIAFAAEGKVRTEIHRTRLGNIN
jgi:D-arabinose 1-dehydrogenase-like Zn-dependent alcohol dehydrogenase